MEINGRKVIVSTIGIALIGITIYFALQPPQRVQENPFGKPQEQLEEQ